MPRRILIAKPGLDGHDRGAKVIARALRDAGCEIVYSGLHQTPEQIVETAIQEDVAGIGLSVLSGAHMTLFPGSGAVAERDASDIWRGGHPRRHPALKAGLAEIFTGTARECRLGRRQRSGAEGGPFEFRAARLAGSLSCRQVARTGDARRPPSPRWHRRGQAGAGGRGKAVKYGGEAIARA
jgi:methylmalonyl-CoA mutase C-terminal domain/subunit